MLWRTWWAGRYVAQCPRTASSISFWGSCLQSDCKPTGKRDIQSEILLNLSAVSIQDSDELMSQLRRCSRFANRNAPNSPGSVHLIQAQFHLGQHMMNHHYGASGLPVWAAIASVFRDNWFTKYCVVFCVDFVDFVVNMLIYGVIQSVPFLLDVFPVFFLVSQSGFILLLTRNYLFTSCHGNLFGHLAIWAA